MFNKKILNIIISISILHLQLFAAQTPAIEKRTKTRIDNFLNSPKPSNIPFIEYSKEFTPQKNNLISKLNLSEYSGLQIYAGYGVYDEDNKYCKYVEKPGLFPSKVPADNIKTFYSNPRTFQGRSYAISLENMNYSQCQSQAEHFGGTIASPVDSSENAFISTTLGTLEGWIGLERNGCNTPYFANSGTEQFFTAWSTQNSSSCLEGANNVYMTRFGTWIRSDKSKSKRCVIEIDSPFIERPIKICAPWWSIEREYAKDFTLFMNNNISADHFTQIDIPENMSICTKYDSPLKESEEVLNRDVTCTTYYETSKSFACTKDPLQPQCYTDECEGYIRNACTKIKELTPLKDYTKTKALRDGELVWVKDKVRIRTNIFSCPPAPPSVKECSELSQVIVFPKECPGSDCSLYSECLIKATSKEEKDKCKDTSSCEKIYPSPDLIQSSDYDSSGEIERLRGKCSDGTELFFEVNMQKTNKRSCLEYEEYNLTQTSTRHCVVDRGYHDEEIKVKITDSDPFAEDNKCIRLNSVADSRPKEDKKVIYTNNGYSDLTIMRSVRSSDTNESTSTNLVNIDIDPYIASPQEGKSFGEDSLALERNPYSLPEDGASCTDFKEVWYEWLYNTLYYNIEIISGEEFNSETNRTAKADYYIVSPSSFVQPCEDEEVGNYCYTEVKESNSNILTVLNYFKWIKKSPDIETPEFFVKNTTTEDECKRLILCSGGEYNNQWNSTAKECNFKVIPPPEAPPPSVEDLEIQSCSPASSSSAFTEEINSQKYMYAVADSLNGEWGYYSNHTTKLYKSNNVSFGDISVFPIKEPSKVIDTLHYYGNVIQDSIRTKKSNLLAGAVSGGAAGGAAGANASVYASIGSTGIGLIVVGVAVIVSLVFAKKKKLNEQWSFWELSKFVKPERLIDSKYDYRKIIGKTSSQKCKLFNISGSNFCKVVYANFGTDNDSKTNMSFTGTLKPNQFANILAEWKKNKEQIFTCYGWSKDTTPLIEEEKKITVSYPNCKWYQFNCDKRRSSGSKVLDIPHFEKDMSNYYVGGTNTVSVVVPMAGDYEVKAYDKEGRVLASSITSSESFIPEGSGVAAHAQVMFGLEMSLAKGIKEGTFSNACRFDSMVEWGGGISGIYYENNNTGMYQGCNKSNDKYVLDTAMVKVSVRPLNEDGEFMFDLKKPMPFANRVFLTTLNMEELRRYRCYNDFEGCNKEDFLNE